jgi:serine/threonine protein kinase
MAPEKFSEDNLPIMANDIYSLGATVYEMLSGSLPFGVDGGLIQKKGADIPNLPGDYSMRLKQTIKDCLNAEPWERPTAVKLEEIAIDALSKAPTVIINSESPNQGLIQEEPENDYSFRTRTEQKKSKSPFIIIGIIAAVLVVLALLFFLPKQEDKPEVITTERPQEPIASDPVESAEPPVQAIEQPEQKEDPPVQKVEPPVRMIEPATVVVTEKPQSTPKTLDLGYATWEGKSTNGKPDGYGTLIFRTAHRIDSRDDQGRVAQSGDKVKGNYINGHLEYGTWIKTSGEQEEIFIGQ